MNDLIGAWTWLTTAAHWQGEKGVGNRLGEHLYYSGVCLVIACLVALPLALWLGHLGKGGTLAVNISNVGRAVPTLAVLVLLSLTPLGAHEGVPTLIALVLFAVPPLLTNAYLGMREVDRPVVEAARGMGMSGWQLFRRVELPLAQPLLMTGLRTAACPGRRHGHARRDGRGGRARPDHHRRVRAEQHPAGDSRGLPRRPAGGAGRRRAGPGHPADGTRPGRGEGGPRGEARAGPLRPGPSGGTPRVAPADAAS